MLFLLPEAVKVMFKFQASFLYANPGSIPVFSANPNFNMWAVLFRIKKM
jgi:hypothetical protein